MSQDKNYPETFSLSPINAPLPPNLLNLYETNTLLPTTKVLVDLIDTQNDFNQQVHNTLIQIQSNLSLVENLLSEMLCSKQKFSELATSENSFQRSLADNIIKVKKALGVVE